MSYNIEFDGELRLSEPLSEKIFEEIENLNEGYKTIYDNEIPRYGYSTCPWYIDDETKMLLVCEGGNVRIWEEWLEFIINRILSPNNILVNGEIIWQGEEVGDVGKIIIRDNIIQYLDLEDLLIPDKVSITEENLDSHIQLFLDPLNLEEKISVEFEDVNSFAETLFVKIKGYNVSDIDMFVYTLLLFHLLKNSFSSIEQDLKENILEYFIETRFNTMDPRLIKLNLAIRDLFSDI